MKALLLLVAVVLIGCGENNVTENPNVDDSDRGTTTRTGEPIEERSGADTNNAAEDR
jgi:hypothetical protein